MRGTRASFRPGEPGPAWRRDLGLCWSQRLALAPALGVRAGPGLSRQTPAGGDSRWGTALPPLRVEPEGRGRPLPSTDPERAAEQGHDAGQQPEPGGGQPAVPAAAGLAQGPADPEVPGAAGALRGLPDQEDAARSAVQPRVPGDPAGAAPGRGGPDRGGHGEHGGTVPGRRAAPGRLHRRVPQPAQAGPHAPRQDREAAGAGAEGAETRAGPRPTPGAPRAGAARAPALPSRGWRTPLRPPAAHPAPAAPGARGTLGHALPSRRARPPVPRTAVPAPAPARGPARAAGLPRAARAAGPAPAPPAPAAPAPARLHPLGPRGRPRLASGPSVWRRRPPAWVSGLPRRGRRCPTSS